MVEYNYKTYFTLYDKFVKGTLTDTDNNAILYLANQCPGTDGAVVYKARALYNYINKTAALFNENCYSLATVKERSSMEATETPINKLQVDLYPNPANNFVTLYVSNVNEQLTVLITDVGGKVLEELSVVTIEHIANINLKLQNGVYFVTITNSSNDKLVKKLIINK